MATADERRAFGLRLRELREAHDWTLDQLADALSDAGERTSAANVGAWERGQYAPRKRAIVGALERALDAPGQLAPLLGVILTDLTTWPRVDGDDYNSRIARMPEHVRRAIDTIIEGEEGRGR